MNRLRKRRENAGLTLEALAERVGSSKAYMWQLENKPNPQPTVRLAWKISKALGVDIPAIFDVQ